MIHAKSILYLIVASCLFSYRYVAAIIILMMDFITMIEFLIKLVVFTSSEIILSIVSFCSSCTPIASSPIWWLFLAISIKVSFSPIIPIIFPSIIVSSIIVIPSYPFIIFPFISIILYAKVFKIFSLFSFLASLILLITIITALNTVKFLALVTIIIYFLNDRGALLKLSVELAIFLLVWSISFWLFFVTNLFWKLSWGISFFLFWLLWRFARLFLFIFFSLLLFFIFVLFILFRFFVFLFFVSASAMAQLLVLFFNLLLAYFHYHNLISLTSKFYFTSQDIYFLLLCCFISFIFFNHSHHFGTYFHWRFNLILWLNTYSSFQFINSTNHIFCKHLIQFIEIFFMIQYLFLHILNLLLVFDCLWLNYWLMLIFQLGCNSAHSRNFSNVNSFT